MDKEGRKIDKYDLKSAFGKDWNKLSEERKEVILDKIDEIFESKKIRSEKEIEEALMRISNRKWGVGMVFLGLLLGVFGSLFATVINKAIFEKFLGNYELLYVLVITGLFIFTMWFFDRFFQKKVIDESYRKNNILNSLLELTKEFEEDK